MLWLPVTPQLTVYHSTVKEYPELVIYQIPIPLTVDHIVSLVLNLEKIAFNCIKKKNKFYKPLSHPVTFYIPHSCSFLLKLLDEHRSALDWRE